MCWLVQTVLCSTKKQKVYWISDLELRDIQYVTSNLYFNTLNEKHQRSTFHTMRSSSLPPTTIDALVIFAVVLLTHIIAALYNWYHTRDDRNEKCRLENELRPIKRKMKQYEGNMDYFVALSKLQRQANKLEQQLNQVKAKLGESVASGGALGMLDKVLAYANPKKWKEKAKSYSVQAVCGVFIVYYWWGVPLLQFPENFFWPFGWMLSKPWLPSGSIGALGWFIVCTRAVPRIMSSVAGVFER